MKRVVWTAPARADIVTVLLVSTAWSRLRKRNTISSMSELKPETAAHLIRVEKAIQSVKVLLSHRGYAPELRTAIAVGFLTQMIEHHEAMVLLIRGSKIGSAFALARNVYEGMFRGLWISLCATDAQIQRFEKDDNLPLKMYDMAVAIDVATGADPSDPDDQFFVDLKNRGWIALCSYAHTGLLQLGRRFGSQGVGPSYRDDEITEITTSSTTCVLLFASRFFALHGQVTEAKETDSLIGSYGPLLTQKGA